MTYSTTGLKDVTPRDLLSYGMTRANAAKLALEKGRGKPNEKDLQLAYRDTIIDLHKRVCWFFGDPLFEDLEKGKSK